MGVGVEGGGGSIVSIALMVGVGGVGVCVASIGQWLEWRGPGVLSYSELVR